MKQKKSPKYPSTKHKKPTHPEQLSNFCEEGNYQNPNVAHIPIPKSLNSESEAKVQNFPVIP